MVNLLSIWIFLALVLFQCYAINQDTHVLLVDNNKATYLRTPRQQVPVSFSATNAALFALLGLQPSFVTDDTVAAEVDSLLTPNVFSRPRALLDIEIASASQGVLKESEGGDILAGPAPYHSRQVTGSPVQAPPDWAFDPAVRVHSLECPPHFKCDASCVEQVLGVGAAQNATEPLVEVAREAACLLNRRAFEGAPLQESSKGTQLFRVHLKSLTGIALHHGTDSGEYRAASLCLAAAIQKVIAALEEVWGGGVSSRVMLLPGAATQHDRGWHMHMHRQLLQAAQARDLQAWQDTALATVAGFVLIVITLIALTCMCAIEIKQDTLLYTKGKVE